MSESKELIRELVKDICAIEDEAADKRCQVRSDTVAEAQESLAAVQDMEEAPLSEDYLSEIEDDLNKLFNMSDGAPKRSIDHLAVQELSDSIVMRCEENDFSVF